MEWPSQAKSSQVKPVMAFSKRKKANDSESSEEKGSKKANMVDDCKVGMKIAFKKKK